MVGQLLLRPGAVLEDALGGLAGVGGRAIPLASFALEARGEAVAPQRAQLRIETVGGAAGALKSLEVHIDVDADGAVDRGESSVVGSAVSLDVQGLVDVALSAPALTSGRTVHYLIVGEFSAALAPADQVRVVVEGLQGGAGQVSGLPAWGSGDPIIGPLHRASGYVDVVHTELAERQANRRGTIAVGFNTASPLRTGDQIILRFPQGFDLSQARLDEASRGPNSGPLAKVNWLSSRSALVVEVLADEPAGAYALVLDDVVNPPAATGLSIDVSTRRADGRTVDGADLTPFLFDVEEVGLSLACRADFDGDGRVYFADLFLFGDAFGYTASNRFDLDGDGRVDFTDFFAFSEVFAQPCDPSQIDTSPRDEALPLNVVEALPGGVDMHFALVRAGSFSMGSPAAEVGRLGNEGPQRKITLTSDFYLGQYEVTQAQWRAVMGTAPWAGQPAVLEDGRHPAVYISWSDAQAFVRVLNAAAGDSLYRLPSEAEWEYAARAGTGTRWSFGDVESMLADYAWTRTVPPVVSELITHAVGSKRPNPWDLYDVHGSASEWVQDHYAAYPAVDQIDPQGPRTGSDRVLRGGGALLSAEMTRSAARAFFAPDVRLSTFGLRILKRLP